MGHIYKIINNINQKVYIGQTKNPIQYRWQNHLWKGKHPEKEDTDYPLYKAMRKYGIENFTIEEVEQVSDEFLDEKEIFWIKQYNSLVPNGYNCDLGGAGVNRFNHQEILNYFLNEGERNASKTARHFKCTVNTVLKILQNEGIQALGKYQPIYQIDINSGEIINEFQSLVLASEALHISKTQLWEAVNSQAKTAGGYAWCKIQDYDNFILDEHIDSKKIKIICQENKKIFNSISEAVLWLKNNNIAIKATHANIAKACNGQRKSAYGFHWSKI